MISDFFRKPYGVGSGLNVYMFSPARIVHAFNVLRREPHYFYSRLKVIIYQLLFPKAPWLTQQAIAHLQGYLNTEMMGFEWGSGRSTLWFAKRLKYLVSIEDDRTWFERVLQQVNGLNVDYRHVATDSTCQDYAGQILEFPDQYFDLIVVDGSCRDLCIRNAVSKVKVNGLIVVDNADSDIDVTPLANLECIPTNNGVWRTDLYIKRNTL